MAERDALNRFLIEHTNVRGALVRLDDAWQTVAARRDYPAPVRGVLGEALAAVSLLAATIKFDGSLIVQASGDGPLPMLVVQASGRRTLRGLARWRGEVPEAPFGALAGNGHLAITIDPGPGRDRYQGIVGLEGEHLAGVLERYFQRSEQLPTRLWLAADASRAAGLLLQALPGDVADPDAWDRCSHLAATVTAHELLGLPAEALLGRLYHQEPVRLFEAEPWAFRCGCSAERVRDLVRALGPDEAHETLAEQGAVAVDCEFCGARYRLDAVDVEQVFAGSDPRPAGGTRH